MFGRKRTVPKWKVYGKPGSGVEADLSLRERLGVAQAAWVLFKMHRLVGVGAGGYAAHTGGRLAHNAVLEVLAETGLIGFVLLVVWVLQMVSLPWRGPTEDRAVGGWAAWNVLWLMLLFDLFRAQFNTLFDENRLLFFLTPVLLLVAVRKHKQ